MERVFYPIKISTSVISNYCFFYKTFFYFDQVEEAYLLQEAVQNKRNTDTFIGDGAD